MKPLASKTTRISSEFGREFGQNQAKVGHNRSKSWANESTLSLNRPKAIYKSHMGEWWRTTGFLDRILKSLYLFIIKAYKIIVF